MAERNSSIKDVAALAGVSTATVSNVLNSTKPVSETIASKVRKAAADLGYRANRAASQLRSGKTRVVAILVPDLSDPFFTSLITELESLAQLGGYEIFVANSNDDPEIERGRLEALLAWRPAGMVVIPCSDVMPKCVADECGDVPFVLADRIADTSLTDTVLIDNEDAGRIAGKYIAEIGHRDVLLVASDLKLAAIRQRCKGAEDAIARFGGRVRTLEMGSDASKGSRKFARWMERNDPPTAVFALTDMMTLAVLTCFAQRKTEIPQQISVVGFDDYPWMSARRTALTAVRQPIVEIARAIWERLDARMNGDRQRPQSIVLDCTLEIRDSSQPVKVSQNPKVEKTTRSTRPEDSEPPSGTAPNRGKPKAQSTREDQKNRSRKNVA